MFKFYFMLYDNYDRYGLVIPIGNRVNLFAKSMNFILYKIFILYRIMNLRRKI